MSDLNKILLFPCVFSGVTFSEPACMYREFRFYLSIIEFIRKQAYCDVFHRLRRYLYSDVRLLLVGMQTAELRIAYSLCLPRIYFVQVAICKGMREKSTISFRLSGIIKFILILLFKIDIFHSVFEL